MSFANQEFFLLALLLVPYVIWYVFSHKKRSAYLKYSFINSKIAKVKSYKNYILHLPFILRIIGLLFVIIVMCRPQTSLGWQEKSVEGVDIMLAIDVSDSMLAIDMKPNRLEAAKNVAIDFIGKRENDNIGLTVFAGEAFTQCPLTINHSVLISMISQANTGLMDPGTAIGMGLSNAILKLKDSKSKTKIIILLTDGVNNSYDVPPITAAKIAKTYGIKIYTIGAGTDGEAPYPITIGGTTQYINMEVEIDEELLKEIANITGGKYFRATDNETLKEVYEEIDKLEKTKLNIKKMNKKEEKYLWFAVVAFLMLILEFVLRNTILRKTI